ncbi:hypothetical protein KBC04_03770 [Candidatus Babeliales bacterium]|nr:hypothetical protein [Candidatus Babeliales bacterium]MBP9844186.1 hypothetical protein [Candidatus Babeliales bacterium]
MKFNVKFMLCIVSIFSYVQAQPVIRKIDNRKTPFQFTVVSHNDLSDCSPVKKGQVITIEPYSLFKEPLLLGSEKPGLLLRPSAFYDKVNKKMYSFMDKNGLIDKHKLEKAFAAWKKTFGKKYKKSVDVWFAQWLCGDISLIHNHVEIFGYLLNISIARIDNQKNYHACMVDYSEGLFSRQVIDIIIDQKSNKGIIPHVKSFVGQGGLCQDGEIVSV